MTAILTADFDRVGLSTKSPSAFPIDDWTWWAKCTDHAPTSESGREDDQLGGLRLVVTDKLLFRALSTFLKHSGFKVCPDNREMSAPYHSMLVSRLDTQDEQPGPPKTFLISTVYDLDYKGSAPDESVLAPIPLARIHELALRLLDDRTQELHSPPSLPA